MRLSTKITAVAFAASAFSSAITMIGTAEMLNHATRITTTETRNAVEGSWRPVTVTIPDPDATPAAFRRCVEYMDSHDANGTDPDLQPRFCNNILDNNWRGWDSANSWGFPNCHLRLSDTSIVICPNGRVETS